MSVVRPAIGVDIGGTKVAAGVIHHDGTIENSVVVASPASDVDSMNKAVLEAVAAVRTPETLAVGIAAAGFIDSKRGCVAFAPNIAWRDMPLRDFVADNTGLAASLENDANAAAWGEYVVGAGHDVEDMLMITLGTGVGGGIVTGGHLLRGAHGAGGEVGHITLHPGGYPCGCGLLGCLEAYGSGQALRRLVEGNTQSSADRSVVQSAYESLGRPADAVAHGVSVNDAWANDILTEYSQSLALGTASLCAVLDPEVVVLGGGVSVGLGEPLRAALHHELTSIVEGAGNRQAPEVRLASLGSEVGLIGAGLLAPTVP